MKSKRLISVLLWLLLIASMYLAVSSLLDSQFCLVGSADGVPSQCDSVQNTGYGKILGIKLSYIGFFAFLSLLILNYLSNKKGKYKENFYEIYLLFSAIGTLSAIYLVFIQFFILKQTCPNCLIVDGLMILVGVLSFVELYHKRR